MKKPTAKREWTLSYCASCHRDTHFLRVKDRTFQCVECGLPKELREMDRGRDARLE